MNLIELRTRAVEVAIGELGVRETAPNRGPRIRLYQDAAGIKPGDPWCMAFVVWCFEQAARSLGMESPLPRSGKVARFWRRCPDNWKGGFPSVGAIYCRLTTPSDPESPGHCGIVIRETEQGIAGVEGNTNDAGARDGDNVQVRQRTLRYVNLGFVDIGREGPADVARVV